MKWLSQIQSKHVNMGLLSVLAIFSLTNAGYSFSKESNSSAVIGMFSSDSYFRPPNVDLSSNSKLLAFMETNRINVDAHFHASSRIPVQKPKDFASKLQAFQTHIDTMSGLKITWICISLVALASTVFEAYQQKSGPKLKTFELVTIVFIACAYLYLVIMTILELVHLNNFYCLHASSAPNNVNLFLHPGGGYLELESRKDTEVRHSAFDVDENKKVFLSSCKQIDLRRSNNENEHMYATFYDNLGDLNTSSLSYFTNSAHLVFGSAILVYMGFNVHRESDKMLPRRGSVSSTARFASSARSNIAEQFAELVAHAERGL